MQFIIKTKQNFAFSRGRFFSEFIVWNPMRRKPAGPLLSGVDSVAQSVAINKDIGCKRVAALETH